MPHWREYASAGFEVGIYIQVDCVSILCMGLPLYLTHPPALQS